MFSAGDKTYTYNDRGQQTGYSNGTTAAAYAYNPSGLRNVKTVGGSTKYFVYNGMNIVYEYTESVADGVAYFYGLNRTHNSEGEIYLYNAHGDVVQLVKNNAVVASYTYDAFGNLTSQIGNSENPFLYCGEYFDAETQTYYLRARYYNPANGRFTQQDAWAFMDVNSALGINLYLYCYGNPIRYADPSGHAVTEWDRKHLSTDEINELYKLTIQWTKAYEHGDTAAMKQIHNKAVEIRQASLHNGETVLDDGNVVSPGPAIALSKTNHTQRDTGMRGLSDEEISRRARDRSLPGETRKKYQSEEKLRGLRNKQKRKSIYNHAEMGSTPVPSVEVYTPAPTANNDDFLGTVGTLGLILIGLVYLFYSGDPSMVEQVLP